ncbi:GYD domain-containing protein [Nonomuraea sp. NPDC049784]|uniref:GYD domain-containing protein n=1 Tax=Nonomuraea sp. NPDC049784 TaxID=3154361 RepID=UPI0033E8888A
MDLDDAGCRARYLIRDRDTKFPALMDEVLADAGIQTVLTVERTAESVGGRVEQMYFAFGESDTFVILDLPSNAASAALASGFRGEFRVS